MRSSPNAHRLIAIAFVAASMLAHQILLTRICALRLFFHFAFLVISNCLLGMGLSGTLLTLNQDRWRPRQRHWLTVFCAAYAASLVGAYALLLGLPLPEPLDLGRVSHVAALTAFSLVGAVPFVLGGTVVGMLLTFNPEEVSRLYAADLVAAGLGCAACPLLLPTVGAGGVFVVTVMLAAVATTALAFERFGRRALGAGGAALVAGAALVPNLDARFPVPSKGFLDYLRAVETQAGVTTRFSRWTANSRIDLVSSPDRTSDKTGSIMTLGTHRRGLPPVHDLQVIMQDADAATVIVNFSDNPAQLALLQRSLYSAAVRLKSEPRVFIIGVGGGNDVWAAKAAGARRIKAVELNAPILEIHRGPLRHYSRALVEAPHVELVVGEGRTSLMRETETYDVIQMTGIDTWTALASGAYVLAENYLYTVEALQAMYRRLDEGGILQITRMAREMEALRMMSNLRTALESFGVTDLSDRVIALSTADQLMAIQVKKGVFSPEERASTLDFAQGAGLGVEYVPGRTTAGPYSELLRTRTPEEFVDAFPRDISPTTDDRPYFFNFTKWSNPLASRRYAEDVPSVSQGNPFFLLSQLGVSLVLSALLVVAPIARRKSLPRSGAGSTLAYFASLGLGFIFVEVVLLQKLTLVFGQPVYSLAVTLAALLVFTGVGSVGLAGRLRTDDRRIWAVPVALAVLLVAFGSLSEPLVRAMIGLPLAGRIAATVAVLAPIGVLLGVPFAFGIRAMGERNPELLPWAWAINGAASVVGSILTVVLSMNYGFAAVLWLAAAIYLLGFAALRRELARPAAG